jgi:hypothetical protein
MIAEITKEGGIVIVYLSSAISVIISPNEKVSILAGRHLIWTNEMNYLEKSGQYDCWNYHRREYSSPKIVDRYHRGKACSWF